MRKLKDNYGNSVEEISRTTLLYKTFDNKKYEIGCETSVGPLFILSIYANTLREWEESDLFTTSEDKKILSIKEMCEAKNIRVEIV